MKKNKEKIKKRKWDSRKLFTTIGFNIIMGAITAFVPALAPYTIKAATTVTGIYLGAQGIQNAVEKFGGRDARRSEDSLGDLD